MNKSISVTREWSNLNITSIPALLAVAAMFMSLVPGGVFAGQLTVLNSEPVQVHVFGPVRDQHKETEIVPRELLSTRVKPGSATSVEAVDTPVTLRPPIRPGTSNPLQNAFSISAFVDHDDAFPDQLTDWNCGDRTYDTESNNHNGTDYQSIQFPWYTMANDGLIVVAAADGTIVDRHDGESDQQCAFSNDAEPNFVVVEHSDNTYGIYAHFKTGSVTPRRIGDRVEQGDYLGVVGSSGFSSGPHLHLGLQDSTNRLIDPYAGSCNLTTDDSRWEDQENYYEKGIAAVTTHSASPEYPPCPQQEVPHFSNVFATTDPLFLGVTVRDFEDIDTIDVELLSPSGQLVWNQTYSQAEFAFAPNISIAWGLQFSGPLPEGVYTWQATYAGETMSHTFHIGAGPDPAPAAVAANNAFTGLWYDTLLDGEGYNVVTADVGTIFYFYGNDNRGNRLWLISDVVPGPISAGGTIVVNVYESSGGVFPTPVQSSRGLSAWGTLTIRFIDCERGEAILSGADGNKTSQIIKLVGVSGASCNDGETLADAGWSGLWYDASKDGEGYNLLVTPVGRILYFYGFKQNGLRLWLISDVMTDELAVGPTIETTVYEATQGTFPSPVPSGDSLVVWGTAKITLIDCNHITIVLTGTDGSKTSNTVRLTGIIGLTCNG